MQKSQRILCLRNELSGFIKCMSTVRTVIKLDEKVTQDLENVVYKPRKHPGVMKYRNIQVPDDIVSAIEASTKDYPLTTLVRDGASLSRYLKCRHAPLSKLELKDKYLQVQSKLATNEKYNMTDLSEEEKEKVERNLHNKVLAICKKQTYGWKPIDYNDVMALTYLLGRSAQEYAVLVRIFGEIHDRIANYKPRSFFDFGSGVGTGTWAVRRFWNDTIFEYFCVDPSSSMNDLADIILRGGQGNSPNPLKSISFRQFLPAANNLTYDIVLCAYTLFEMSSPEMRLQKLLNLWNKSEQFLVIVEQGTNAGFKLISEARDFLLQYNAKVFAPCPHTKPCPRFLTDTTPCNFEVRYSTLPLAAISQVKQELFSYIVLEKKSESLENLKKESLDSSKWPRIVRPTLVKSKHTVCRMCTAEGCLKEVVATASKHGKLPYYCVRKSNWGDLLPVTLSEKEKQEINSNEVT